MMSMRNAVTAMVLCTMVATAAGCAPARAGRAANRASGPVRVVVDNRNWEDATVYLERAGARFRIALVPALSSKTLTIDSRLLNPGMDVRLIAQTRLTRETFYSNRFDAVGARALELQIGSRLAMSMVSVF